MTALIVLLAFGAAAAPGQLPDDFVEKRVLVDFSKPLPKGMWRGEVVEVDGVRAGKMVVERRDGPSAAAVDFSSLGIEISDWDALAFEYRIEQPGLSWWGIKVIDYPLADGYQAVWEIRDGRLLVPGRWHTAVVDLRHPQQRWGRQDKSSQVLLFRAELAKNAHPVTVLIRRVVLQRRALRAELAAVSQRRVTDRWLSRTYTLRLTNKAKREAQINLTLASKSPAVEVVGAPRTLRIRPGETIEIQQVLRVARAKTAPLSRYTAELVVAEAESGAELAKVVMYVSAPLGKLPHPLLLLRRDEIPEVLAAARKDKGLDIALKGIIKSADAWLKKPLDFPDRGSQWWHWYTCKKCGARLRTESPTRHVCPNCGAVYSGWPYDDVVLARQHSALARAARDLGLAYLLTGRREYARRAAEVLLGYADRYEKYPLHDVRGRPGRGARVGPQTLDEATWLIPITQGFDAIQDTLTPEERQKIVDHLLLPAAKVTWSPRMGIHNISCWRNSAYALVGMALDNEEMVDAAVNGPAGFREQIRRGVIEPGFWYEGSWGYHFYTMNALLPFVEAAVRAGIDVLSDKYRGMYEAPVRFVAPDLRLPAFNDSGYVNLRGSAWMYQVAARHWPDSREIQWAASLAPLGGWATLLWGVRKVDNARMRFTSRLEREAGYMVFRTNPWEGGDETLPDNYLVLDFGPHGGGHGHPDKLNIVWWAYRKLMAPDPGSIAYGNPMHGGYYKQTLAHNTVVVDGRSQRASTGELVFFAADGNLGIGCATADDAYPPVKLTRVIAVSGQRVIDVFFASDARPHRYELVYHNRGELRADLAWKDMEKPPDGTGYSWCKNWRQAAVAVSNAVTLHWDVEDDIGVVMCHVPQANETLLTALGHDQPPTTMVPLVIQRVEGKSAIWISALQAFRGKAPDLKVHVISLRRDESGRPVAAAVETSDGERRDVLLVSLDGRELQAGAFRLRGRAALLHYAANKLVAALCAQGTGVWVAGKRIK